jgi:hypothetical protein
MRDARDVEIICSRCAKKFHTQFIFNNTRARKLFSSHSRKYKIQNVFQKMPEKKISGE